MIIVSQDRKQIINLNNIRIVEINNPNTWQQGFFSIDTYPECEDQQKWHIRLGKYATEERAKEVLESITTAYQANKLLECTSGSKEQNQMAEELIEKGIKPFKYEMPGE